MAVKKRGRRAADTPVKTPLSELTEALSANSSVVGRRAAVAAAAGGLIVTVGLPVATQGDNDKDAVVASAEAKDAGNSTEFVNQAKTVVPEAKQGAKANDSLSGSAAPVVKAKKAETPTEEPSQSSSSSSSNSESTQAGTPSRNSTTKSSRSTKRAASDDVSLPNGSKAQQVIGVAKRYVGTPYVLGGTTPSGWDCSGFTSYVYGKVGVNLPRTSGAQRGAGSVVSRSAAKPGDLIWSPGHVGIYAGNGMMYDAGNPRVGTSYRSIDWMVKKGAVFIRVL